MQKQNYFITPLGCSDGSFGDHIMVDEETKELHTKIYDNIFYKLIFLSDVNPTKIQMGLLSMSWAVFDFYRHLEFSLYMTLVCVYGIAIFWRVFDYSHRTVSPAVAALGATLWGYEAWHQYLRPSTATIDIVAPMVFAMAAGWLLLRSGSGVLINRKYCSYRSRCDFKIDGNIIGHIRDRRRKSRQQIKNKTDD